MVVAEQSQIDLSVDFRYRPTESWTSICHADDEYKTLVRGDGALLYRYQRGIWNMYRFDRTIEFSLVGDGPCREIRQTTEKPSGISGCVPEIGAGQKVGHTHAGRKVTPGVRRCSLSSGCGASTGCG